MKRFLVIAVLYGATSFAAEPNILLNKVFYHEGRLQDKIVCYFSEEPTCAAEPMSSNKSSGMRQFSLFLPRTQASSSEAQAMMNAVAQKRSKPYHVRFEQTTKPVPGIRVLITFKEDLIAFDYATFNSISAQKGVTFHFNHKDELRMIKQKTAPLLRVVKNDKPKVVLDCGHGGADEGKVGHFGIKEKDVTLQVGKSLAQRLKSRGYDVALTRSDDNFVALDERTTQANRLQADILVSIHANGAQSEVANGIETYWSGAHLLESKLRCQDTKSHKAIGGLIATRDKASFNLASCIHQAVLGTVQQKFVVIDRKVKSSIGQVIFGSEMPSALIELGFLSHKQEAQRLGSKAYQELLVRGICDGIETYYKKLS